MAVTELATFTDTGNYEYTVTLDGVTYVATFTYNGRDRHWYLGIDAEDRTPLRSGIKLTTGNLVLNLWRNAGRPLGELLMVDPSGADREATFDTIGVEVFLIYLDQPTLVGLAGG